MLQKTDEELISDVQHGLILSFNYIIKKYQTRIYYFIHRFVKSDEEAEDLTQETFFGIYRRIDNIDPKRKFSSYLYAAARNTAISFLRKNKKNISLELLDLDSGDEDLYSMMIRQDMKEEVKLKISGLDSKYRDLIIDYYYNDLNYQNLSDKYKIPLNTVRIRLKRAKDQLKNILKL